MPSPPKTVLNPATGRRVLKSGAIGRKVLAARAQAATRKPKQHVSKKQLTCLLKTKTTPSGEPRPSARAMHDAGYGGPVY